MLRTIILLFFTLFVSLQAQHVILFDIDETDFPVVRAKFYAFDPSGKPYSDLGISDFNLTENLKSRQILDISCPPPQSNEMLAVALSFDASGSMVYNTTGINSLKLAKQSAKALVNALDMPPDEVAVQKCTDRSLIIADFNEDAEFIKKTINALEAEGGNDFAEQLLSKHNGLFKLCGLSNKKRVAVIFTDVSWKPLTKQDLAACKKQCDELDIQFFAVFCSYKPESKSGIHQSLQEICDYTGGAYFDGVSSPESAAEIAGLINSVTATTGPCTIEWLSGTICSHDEIEVELTNIRNGSTGSEKYLPPAEYVSGLQFEPESIQFPMPEMGIEYSQEIVVTAIKDDFEVTEITKTREEFSIEPTSFYLAENESTTLTVKFTAKDSVYIYCKFGFENSLCPSELFASGGYPGVLPVESTIELLAPNGGEQFIAGMDTIISWDGIPPDELTVLQYSIDEGRTWITIDRNAKGHKFRWKVPDTPSKKCLARVIAKSTYILCDNDNVDACEQEWMGCNLNVTTYRDGTSLMECKTYADWKYANDNYIGAYCNYNYDENNAHRYGRLYNYYALQYKDALAPEGWRIATDKDWKALERCAGMPEEDIIKTGWRGSGIVSMLEQFGFNFQYSGYRHQVGLFLQLGSAAYYWSPGSLDACYRCIRAGKILRGTDYKGNAFAVRCVRRGK